MERRDHLMIIAEILRIARKGVKKTHLVYKANLNHALLEKYLVKLEKQGLISRSNESERKIQTTERGKQFIEKYLNLQTVLTF
ncbi:MAG: winged helix-turn-helix domain-containing protein [Candidatus Bathyarchaeia archaeon]